MENNPLRKVGILDQSIWFAITIARDLIVSNGDLGRLIENDWLRGNDIESFYF